MTKRIGTWTHRLQVGDRGRWTQVDLVVVDDGLGRIDLSRTKPQEGGAALGSVLDVGPTPGPNVVRAIELAVAFAISEAGCPRHSVELHRIRILSGDATAAAIAVAVVLATWDALGFAGAPEQLRALDGIALGPPEDPLDFDPVPSCRPWALFRQDDHGNRFLVERFADRPQAEAARHDFEARGHKQLYWVERAHGTVGGVKLD